MKKKLNIDSITNELEGASLFFTKQASPPSQSEPEKAESKPNESSISAKPLDPEKEPEKIKSNKKRFVWDEKDIIFLKPEKHNSNDTLIPSHHDTTTPRYRDTTTPKIHGVVIELIRKAVKEFGKEAATHRFTEAEKRQIADLIYTYKNSGIKTSENEITRIAVNFVMEDYRENGENSVLHKILKALKE